jgi:hypothetical protein
VAVAERLARLPAEAFAAFEPFPTPGDDDDELYGRLLWEDRSRVSSGAATWARRVKDARLALSERFKLQSAEARAVARGHRKLTTFSEALAAEPALRRFAASFLSSDGRRRMVVSDPKELFQAVMSNPYLRHFFHVWLFFTISLTRLWANQELNRDAVSGRDDLADLTLALYVGPNDAVLTRDRLLVDAFRFVDPSVQTLTAADL